MECLEKNMDDECECQEENQENQKNLTIFKRLRKTSLSAKIEGRLEFQFFTNSRANSLSTTYIQTSFAPLGV